MASIPDGLYTGCEVQFWFEGQMLYAQSSSGCYISGDPVDGVTEAWFVKGPSGEFLEWYWDADFKNPIRLGDNIYGHHFQEWGVTLFLAIYGKRMDIKLKMGAKNSLPSTKNKGTVYFAKDGDKNFGELYYDDENGNRVKVGGTNISSAEFKQVFNLQADVYDTLKLNLNFEDGTVVSGEMPFANWNRVGLMSVDNPSINNIQYMPLGTKIFTTVGVGFPSAIAGDDAAPLSLGFGPLDPANATAFGLFNEFLVFFNGAGDVMFGMGQEGEQKLIGGMITDDNGFNQFILTINGFLTNALGIFDLEDGSPIEYIQDAAIVNIFAGEITADTIQASTIIGEFTGDLEGTAHFATQWFAPITLNGTEVQGGETSEVITAKWGAARNISISSAAGTTGTSVDGSAEAGYTLVIPATMTGFTSITSTTMLPTYLGSAESLVTTSHVEEIYLHNPNNKTYKHKLTSNAGNANCDLQLPNTSGLLISKASTTAAVGDTNSPVYVALNGEVTACSTIAVDHGGTGLNTVAAGSLLYGNGTGNMGTIAANAKGKLLGSNGTSAAPIYLEPTVSFTTGTSAPKVRLTINGVNYDSSAGIQSASASNPGIVSTGTQTFKGSKTFSDAATFSSGISSTTGTFSGQINANADIKLVGNLKSSSSGTSYVTLTDTRATITSPTLHLNGTTLVLNSSNYGTSLPTTGLEEGRVFFLLT